MVSHRSVHFPDSDRADRCMTLDYDMAHRTDAGNSSRTATSNFSTTVGSVDPGAEKPKCHPNDSYISPNGMITSEGIIGMSPFSFSHPFDRRLILSHLFSRAGERQGSKETVNRPRRRSRYRDAKVLNTRRGGD